MFNDYISLLYCSLKYTNLISNSLESIFSLSVCIFLKFQLKNNDIAVASGDWVQIPGHSYIENLLTRGKFNYNPTTRTYLDFLAFAKHFDSVSKEYFEKIQEKYFLICI